MINFILYKVTNKITTPINNLTFCIMQINSGSKDKDDEVDDKDLKRNLALEKISFQLDTRFNDFFFYM